MAPRNLKEYGEHLRTVHFATLAVSVALWAATVVDQPRVLQTAAADIDGISYAESLFVNGWLNKYLQSSAAEFAKREQVGIAEQYLDVAIPFSGKTYSIALHVPANYWSIVTPEIDRLTATPELSGVLDFDDDDEAVAVAPAHSLADFRHTWEVLNGIDTLYMISSVGDTATVEVTPTTYTIDPAVGGGRIFHGKKETHRLPVQPSRMHHEARELSLVPEPHIVDEVLYSLRTTANVSVSNDGDRSNTLALTLSIPVGVVAIPISPQLQLGKETGRRWRTGGFEQTFAELDSVTKHYQDFSPDQIKRVLSSEMSRTTDTFELAGLRVPAGAVSKVGLLVLLGVQVYFLLHVREFNRLAGSGYEADVAWIGLYPDFFSRVVVLLSLFAPAIVAFVVALDTWWTTRSWPLLAVSAALTTASMIVSGYSARAAQSLPR